MKNKGTDDEASEDNAECVTGIWIKGTPCYTEKQLHGIVSYSCVGHRTCKQ